MALGPHGIRFNTASLGTTETATNKRDLEAGGKRAVMESSVLLGRLGKPIDIASPVVFFISGISRYVSG